MLPGGARNEAEDSHSSCFTAVVLGKGKGLLNTSPLGITSAGTGCVELEVATKRQAGQGPECGRSPALLPICVADVSVWVWRLQTRPLQ